MGSFVMFILFAFIIVLVIALSFLEHHICGRIRYEYAPAYEALGRPQASVLFGEKLIFNRQFTLSNIKRHVDDPSIERLMKWRRAGYWFEAALILIWGGITFA